MDVTPAYLEAATTHLCERRLDVFAKEVWHVVEPRQAFKMNWHIEAICRHIEAMVLEKDSPQNLLINQPPGTMKSLLLAMVTAWLWGPANRPDIRHMGTSYAQNLSTRDNMKCRDIIRSEWYQQRWGHRFETRGDMDEKTYFGNDKGGWRRAISVGTGTGEHPDIITIDDIHNVKQAESELQRQSAIDWWVGTMGTRGIARGVKRIAAMQRTHEYDWSGYVLANETWEHINIPMVYEENRMPPTWLDWKDPRTEEGDLLWPAMFTQAYLDEYLAQHGEYIFAGQMQQRPAPRGGGMIKIKNIELVDVAPVEAMRVRAWDKAGTDKSGDWTAGARLARTPDGITYIEDIRREQVSLDARNKLMLQTAQLDSMQFGNTVFILHEQEPGASGKDMATITTRMLGAYPNAPERPTKAKDVRASPFAAQVAAGNVKMVKGDWNRACLEEMERFPLGKNDDQVDSVAMAYNKLALGYTSGLAGSLLFSGGEEDTRLNPLTEEELADASPILRDLIEGDDDDYGGGSGSSWP